MPQMKPFFWLDILSSNSICLMATISVLYFFFLSPPVPGMHLCFNDKTHPKWSWKW